MLRNVLTLGPTRDSGLIGRGSDSSSGFSGVQPRAHLALLCFFGLVVIQGVVPLAPDIVPLPPNMGLEQAVTCPTVNPGFSHLGQGWKPILAVKKAGAPCSPDAVVHGEEWGRERRGGVRVEALLGKPHLCDLCWDGLASFWTQ